MAFEMTTMSEPQDAPLEIHVINRGYGESIVVRTPGGAWGVVDCYTRSLAKPELNPTIQFLEANSVERLEFLALTHPHDDHFRGMSALVARFRPRQFWPFGAFTRAALENLILYSRADAWRSDDRYESEAIDDFGQTLVEIRKLRDSGELSQRAMCDVKVLFPKKVNPDEPQGAEFRILCIAPSSDNVQRYEDGLSACFTTDRRVREDAPRLRHNLVSAALLLEYGQTRILLGGDVEAPSWDGVLSYVDASALEACAFKVSHHGALSGYNENLWSILTRRGEPYAVIAPSKQHGLPEGAAISKIKNHTTRVYVTHLPALSSVSGSEVTPPRALGFPLSTVFRERSVSDSTVYGRCTLAFDSHGNCQRAETHGSAALV